MFPGEGRGPVLTQIRTPAFAGEQAGLGSEKAGESAGMSGRLPGAAAIGGADRLAARGGEDLQPLRGAVRQKIDADAGRFAEAADALGALAGLVAIAPAAGRFDLGDGRAKLLDPGLDRVDILGVERRDQIFMRLLEARQRVEAHAAPFGIRSSSIMLCAILSGSTG